MAAYGQLFMAADNCQLIRVLVPVYLTERRSTGGGSRSIVGRRIDAGTWGEGEVVMGGAELVGRVQELGVLTGCLDAALEGSPRVVLCRGEPGIGITARAYPGCPRFDRITGGAHTRSAGHFL